MSTAGRPESNAPAASDIAEQLAGAGLVRVVAAADGDALAAAGLLADALETTETAYQLSVTPLPTDTERTTDADQIVALGRPATEADITLGLGAPASQTAYDVATVLGNPDPVLALAGTVAGGFVPQGPALDDAESAVDRRPGLAVPTTDLIDGLAHSTLVHGPFSGSENEAEEYLEDSAEDAGEVHRRAASIVALTVAGDEKGTVRGSRRVERFLRPYAVDRLVTVGGYADVLDALARTDPGLGLALALGKVEDEQVLQTWRDHSERAHTAVREATTGRYDGLFVARCGTEAPAGTVARLIRDFRSPEPVVLVVADQEAVALATDDTDAGHVLGEAVADFDGSADGTASFARAQFDADEGDVVDAFREAQ